MWTANAFLVQALSQQPSKLTLTVEIQDFQEQDCILKAKKGHDRTFSIYITKNMYSIYNLP